MPLALVALIGLDAAPASAGQPANPWMKRRVLNIAHQGGEDEFPSNTLYAFRKAIRARADMLELDVGVTSDDQVIVMHDTSVDRTTNGTGLVSEKTLAEVQALDAGYWFTPDGSNHYTHDREPSGYPLRGVATGERRPPKGFEATDFRVPTLRSVLQAFPKTPVNIEIRGRTKEEETSEYVYNAEVLARELAGVNRDDLIVVSFQQPAVDRFHELQPAIGVAPGVTGVAGWILNSTPPAGGTVAFQLPITFDFGHQLLDVTTAANVSRTHEGGYAVHTWFGNEDVDGAHNWRKLVDWCVDGIMTSHPVQLEHTLKRTAPRRGARRAEPETRRSALLLGPGLHPAFHLVPADVLDVGAEHPLVPERVTQPAGPVAVELVGERVDHLAPRRDGPLPERVDVGHVERHDRRDQPTHGARRHTVAVIALVGQVEDGVADVDLRMHDSAVRTLVGLFAQRRAERLLIERDRRRRVVEYEPRHHGVLTLRNGLDAVGHGYAGSGTGCGGGGPA